MYFSVTFVARGELTALSLACMRPTSGPKRGALQLLLFGHQVLVERD
jgi:hypothetical protein